MSIVQQNQKGYVDRSMSVRASLAYEDGEMPESKWTKKAMLAVMEDWAIDNYKVFTKNISAMRKKELFDNYFKWTSWHHVSKFANEVDFYSLNEDAVEEISRDMTDDEIDTLNEVRRKERETLQADWEEQEALWKAQDEYKKLHGYKSGSVLAYVNEHPNRVGTRISKKGNELYILYADDKKTQLLRECAVKDADRSSMIGWDAIRDEEN